MTLTKRDKNLLFGLGIILVVVLFGNFIILPQWAKKDEIAVQLNDKQEQKDKMEKVINGIDENKSKLTQLNQTYAGETRDFYDIEESHAMERKITKIILKAGLSTRDFTINDEPQLASLSPYINSSFAKSMNNGSSESTESSSTEAQTATTTEAATTTAASTNTTETTKGTGAVTQNVVYSYTVSVTAQGSKSNMKKLISEIYSNYPAIQITSYNMNTQTALTTTNQVTSSGDLTLTMAVYMCKK
ncbi:MAG: UbiD family decarboxylase [Anaerostipes sp.]|nr:UbiD family decarboxylase [Anaerostipes sp.]